MPHRLRRAVATAAILCALVVAAFEGTVVTSAMPTIASELGGMSVYSWVFSAFLLASTAGVFTSGRLADAFGRRPIFLLGMGLFLVGSALCGAATSMEQLIVFRVVQGLGAGAIQPVSSTVSADLYTLEERARIQGVFTGAWGVACVVGPILGGFIVMHLSWRWVFFVNVPVGALAVALLLWSYRDPPRAPRAPFTWSAVMPAVRAATSVMCRPIVRAGLVGSLFAGALLYLCTTFIPLWMTTHARLDALRAGFALVPLLAGWAAGSAFGVRVMLRRGMRATVAGGFAIALVGATLLAVVVLCDLDPRWAFVALAILGIGLGPAASTSLVATQSTVAWNERGLVTSAVFGSRVLGGSVAVSLFGTAEDGVHLDRVALLALVATVGLAVLTPAGADAVTGGATRTAS
jgi:MFS family permease